MSDIRVQVADIDQNLFYTDLVGVLSLTLSRASGSTPGSLDLVCAADATIDLQTQGKASRFNPRQGIQVSFVDHTRSDAPYYVFVGRIDDATLIDDEISAGQTQRHWHLTARDWLAVLADNTVQPGRWRSVDNGNRGVPFNDTTPWIPNYVGDYTGQHRPSGETRANIITDLCMNVVNNAGNPNDPNDLGNGILGMLFAAQNPNSKPIEKNWNSTSQVTILDAIREISASDPWDSAAPTTDGLGIALRNFPFSAGFGAELQIHDLNDSQTPNSFLGRVLEYYRYGGLRSAGWIFAYPPITNQSVRSVIASFQFGKHGSDLFSRVRPTGQGENLFTVPDGVDGGQAVAFQPTETTWNPLAGWLKTRSEGKSLSAAMVGAIEYAFENDESLAIGARESYDSAYAQIYAGAAALQGTRGGINQGRIVTFGPPLDANGIGTFPLNSITHLFRPGEVIRVLIADLGINDDFVIQSWTYRWPDDQTTYDIGRTPYTSAGQQAINLQQRANQALTTISKSFISQWKVAAPTGVEVVPHFLGTVPSRVTIEAALWDGHTYASGNPVLGPVPMPPSSIVEAPSATFDAAQGQYFGYALGTASSTSAIVYTAYWIAYSDGAGKWLTRIDPLTILRFKVYP